MTLFVGRRRVIVLEADIKAGGPLMVNRAKCRQRANTFGEGKALFLFFVDRASRMAD